MSAVVRMMTTKCANPSCGTTLQSFTEGRFFSFEIVSISIAASDENNSPYDEKPRTQALQYWLCGSCSARVSLVLEPARGLKLVPAGSELQEFRDPCRSESEPPQASDSES